MEFNKRERYLIVTFIRNIITTKLEKSGDFSEKKLYYKLLEKVVNWTHEIKGDITSDQGVGEFEK